MNPSIESVGLIFLVIGAGAMLLLWVSARLARHQRDEAALSGTPEFPYDLASTYDAVIVAETGGHVVYLNDHARNWFGLESGTVDLWIMSQQVRPSDAFLQLFATEGRAVLQMTDRRVEATSHHVTMGGSPQIVVLLRERAPAPALDKKSRDATRATLAISEISRAISASLDLETTVRALLDNLVRLVAFDAGEVCLLGSEKKNLRPAGRVGDRDYHAYLDKAGGVYRLDEGYTGWIARHQQPLVIGDLTKRTDVRPKIDLPDTPFRSYIGLPLMVRNRFVGTLELLSTEPNAYDAEDLSLLNIVADQAAIAIENARLYGEQEERVAELSGLQQIASALGSLQDAYQLFKQLSERIATLMDVEICGVLLYDPDSQALVPEVPAYGVPDNITRMYRVPLKPGTSARAFWEETPFWYSNVVLEEDLVEELNLKGLATAVGVRSTALATMMIGSERIGVVQIANKRDGSNISLDDIRLLQIYAAQAAIVVENNRLYRGEENRVSELQGLQKISQAMSAIADPKELYAQLSSRIGELMNVEMCGILIYDEEAKTLISRPPFYGVSDDLVQHYQIPLREGSVAQKVWQEQDVHMVNDVANDSLAIELGLLEIAQATGVRSTIFVPLSSSGRRFGVIQVSNKNDDADFDQDDARILSIFASQAAALIENARLYEETDENLHNRIEELRSVSRVSRELNATLELDRILRVISEEAVRAEGATCGGVLMPLLESGDGKQRFGHLHFGCTGEHSDALELHVLDSGQTVAVEDFRLEARFSPPHEGVRSALVMPIKFEGRIVGVIELHSDKPRTLGPSTVEFVAALADQAAIAVGNATRYFEQVERGELLQQRAEQLTQIFELSRLFRSDQSVAESLEAMAHGIQEAVGFRVATISMVDETGQYLQHIAAAGLPLESIKNLKKGALPIARVMELMADEFAISGSYFIPHEHLEQHGGTLKDWRRESGASHTPSGTWHPDDLLLVPLRSKAGTLMGLLTADDPHDGMRPTRNVVETLEIFANQAAAIIENSQLYHSMEERADELSRSLEDLEKSYLELDELSRDMIRKDMELSSANERLDQRARRLLALHRVMESIDTTQSPAQVLETIAEAVVREMEVDVCLVALEDGDVNAAAPLALVASAGDQPEKLDLVALLNPDDLITGNGVSMRGRLLTPDNGNQPAALVEGLGLRSLIAQPLALNSDQRGALLVGNRPSNTALAEDDLDLFALLASQVTVEYENAHLYQAVQDEALRAGQERDLLQSLHLVTTALQQSREMELRLKTISSGLQTVGYGKVALVLFDQGMNVSDLVTAGYSPEDEKKLRKRLPDGDGWKVTFEDQTFLGMRVGSSYYLPFDHPWVIENMRQGKPSTAKREGQEWHPKDFLFLPMYVADRVIGLITLSEPRGEVTLTPEKLRPLELFAQQAASALENARLYQEVTQRASELDMRTQRLALLNRISSGLGTTLELDTILRSAIEELVTAINADQSSIVLIDPQGEDAKRVASYPEDLPASDETVFPMEGNPAVDRLQETLAPLAIEDAQKDELLAPMRDFVKARKVKSILLLPLVASGEMIGIFDLASTGKKRHFEAEQIDLAQAIASQVAVAIANARLFEETTERSRELEILFAASQAASSSLELNHVLTGIGRFLTEAIPVEGYRVSLWEKDGDELVTLFDYAKPELEFEVTAPGMRYALANLPVSRRVLESGKAETLYASDPDAAPAELAWLADEKAQSNLMLPLVTRGTTVGLLELWHSSQEYHFTPRDLRLGQAMANQTATAVENARLHDETQQRVNELATINQIGRAITSAITAEDLYQTLYEEIGSVVGARSMVIALHDTITDTLSFPLVVRNTEREQRPPEPFGEGLYAHVIENGAPLLLSGDVAAQAEALGIEGIDPDVKSVLTIPFHGAERAIGALAVLDYDVEDAFDATDQRILETTAAQVAVSIQNARLYDQLQHRLGETTALQEVSRVVNSSLDLSEIFDRVVDELAYAFQYPLIGLYTIEEDQLILQAYHGYKEKDATKHHTTPLDQGVVGRVARLGVPVFIEDVSKDEDYLAIEKWVTNKIAIPISSERGVLGVLNIEAGPDRPLSPNDMSLMVTLTGQVATAMENARLYDEMIRLSSELEQHVEERTRELQEERDTIDTLFRITSELSASLDLDRVLNRALELVGQAVNAEHGSLFLIDPQSERLIWRAVMSDYEVLPPGGRQIPLTRHEGMAGWVMDNRQALLIDNVQDDPRWVKIPGTEERRSMLAAPLIANEDVLGVVMMMSDAPDAFSDAHLRLVEAAANQVATAINNAELYRLIRDQAERLGSMLRSQQVEASKSQAILESVADGVMVSDSAGEIILFNAAAERILDLKRDDVLGKPSSDLTGLYGGGAERWGNVMDQWMSNPGSYREGDFLEERLTLGDKFISVHLSPVAHGDEFLGLVSVFRDITREVEVDRMKSEFVATVSHELRTPMTSIKGYADLLLMGAAGPLAEEQEHFLDIIKNNADRLSDLVNNLLDISRIEQGRVELELTDVQFADVVDALMDSLEGRFANEDKVIRMTVEIPPDLPPVEADRDRVTQILLNIVLNAYQYTPNGGSVTISGHPEAEGVRIDVADTGVGIPPEDQERIFERFFRGEDPVVMATAGTGLGLHIVRQFVEMHHGRLQFESEPGKGTTFTIFFPYTHSQPDEEQEVTA